MLGEYWPSEDTVFASRSTQAWRCEACVAAGGEFCAKDALCAAPGEGPTLEALQAWRKTATCDAGDCAE